VTAPGPVRRAVVTGDDLRDLRAWAAEVEAWPAGSHRFGQYAERTVTGDVICRTENVSACHRGVAGLVAGPLAALAAASLGVAVEDFKDKVNYKHPGGAGFSPHQDLPAYPGVSCVTSVLVAVDECTTESGCVWVAPEVDRVLPADERGVVTAAVSSSLSWVPVELAPGDALCIGGLLPHFSQVNRARRARRVLVASYAPRHEGYGRDRYYAARHHAMARATATDHRFRISALADFEGVAVEGGPVDDPKTCTHG